MRCAVGIVIAGAFAAACAHAPEPETAEPNRPKAESSKSREPSPATGTPSPSGTPKSTTSPASPATARDPLKPEVVDHSPGGDEKYFYRAGDGTTLATLGSVGSHPHLWTRYRIYGPGWTARTPLLQVPALLEILGPVSDGFLGHIMVFDAYATTLLSKVVLVGPDGNLRPVPVAREPAPLQATDEVFTSLSGNQMAYRPSTGQAHKVRAGETGLPGYASPAYFTDTDEACSLADGDDGQVVYWTVDRGHTWRHETTSRLLGSSLEASTCEPAGADHFVLIGSNELLNVARASTVDLSDRTVSSYRLDKRFMVTDNQIFPLVLADGRLAFETLHSGLMVATNPSNSRFEFRPAPVDEYTIVEVVGPEIVHQNRGRRRDLLDISTDAGRTWRTVDLRAGDWAAAS